MMILSSSLECNKQQFEANGLQQTQEKAMAPFPSPMSAVSSFVSVTTTKADDGRGNRGNSAVRTARFRQKKPQIPIRKFLSLPIPLDINLADLLDSPILQPDHQAEPSPSTGISPLSPIVQRNGSMALSLSKSVPKSSVHSGNQSIIYKPVPSFRFATLSNVMGITTATPKAPEVSFSVVDTHKERGLNMRMASDVGHDVSDKVEINHLIVQTELSLVETSSEDGYNWRKYGQKLVKNSKFPRSYYRCAYPNCPVKKMVEKSRVVIKGDHVHPKPEATRRMPSNGALQSSTNMSKQLVKSSSGIPLIPDPSLMSSHIEGPIAKWNRVDEKDTITKSKFGNIDDKDDSKCRKKIKMGETVSKLSLRTFREPCHVERVKCLSDIVDDGYRWCKYGQKTIKGNPHPRSYYKCHSPGCPVRKHVERSATDESTVISTYEGNHNHEAPASRFNAGTFATGMTRPQSSLSKSNLLQLHCAGTKNPEVRECDAPPVHQFVNGADGGQIDRKSGSNVRVIKALPVGSHIACPDKEAVATKTLSFLKSGVDGRSAFQRAEFSKQEGSVLAPKLEPYEQHNASP